MNKEELPWCFLSHTILFDGEITITNYCREYFFYVRFALILGRITISHDAVIGGNVWITEDVPPGAKVLQRR